MKRILKYINNLTICILFLIIAILEYGHPMWLTVLQLIIGAGNLLIFIVGVSIPEELS